MTFQLSIYSYVYLVAGLVSALAAVFTWARRGAPGGRWLFWMLVASAGWAFAEAADFSSLQFSTHLFWGKASYLGASATVALFALFALEYSGRSEWITRQLIILLCVEPVLAIVAAYTNDWHHLLWTDFPAMQDVPHAIVYVHGPIYWAVAAYNLILVAVATALLLDFAARTQEMYRRQSLAITFAALLPWVAGLAYTLGYAPMFDPSITFSLTGAILTVTMLRFKLLDLVPVAREVLVERMSDGLLVLDSRGRIVDINPVAKSLLELGDAKRIGDQIGEALSAWPEAATCLAGTPHCESKAVLLSPKGSNVEFDFAVLPGYDPQETGLLVTLRDMTVYTDTEVALQQANQSLQLRLSEIEALQAELREQATRDALTGLHNRRYLAESLERELGRAAREGYPVSLVMLDIDHFKDTNDKHGHAQGDLVLRMLGARLRTHTRVGDMACRYGGDEFLVVLPNTALTEAAALAERWRLSVQDEGVSPTGPVVPSTISLGVATYPEHGHTVDEVMAAADSAVYAAKAAGRNRVVVAVSTG